MLDSGLLLGRSGEYRSEAGFEWQKPCAPNRRSFVVLCVSECLIDGRRASPTAPAVNGDEELWN